MRRLQLLWLAALAGACTASPTNLECPINTVSRSGACRNVCQSQSECLPSEHCTEGACIPGVALNDGGESAVDAQANRDATVETHPDASEGHPDAAEVRPDAMVRSDAGMPVECHNRDEQSCRATPGCIAYECATCTGSQFATCANPGQGPPPCAAPQCTCDQLGERQCPNHPECTSTSCLDCQGTETFLGCSDPNNPLMCMDVRCGCEAHADQLSCDADPLCHTLFAQICTGIIPPPVCTMQFSRCGEGARVVCNGPVMCRALTPGCDPGYAVATDGFCYEGCVLQGDCAI